MDVEILPKQLLYYGVSVPFFAQITNTCLSDILFKVVYMHILLN